MQQSAIIIKKVIYLLGGLGKALFAEALVKATLGTVWNDPVIRHATTLFGGRPAVDLVPVNTSSDGDLIDRLQQRISN